MALEAAACGIPVIASSVGGLRDLIENNKTGILVEGWDPSLYAQSLSQLLTNPLESTEIAMNAVEKASQFTWGQTAECLLGIYESASSKALVECR